MILPLPFCLACGVGLGAIDGEITGYEGSDYVVRIDHSDDDIGRPSCNTGGVRSVWTQAEVDELMWVL
ncbi:hypothetical protein AB0F88_10965 [Streptosporangium sp. NPDC023963]|uniref:hypothetical protein n=1 Tax=Streptosporangium sp. NPDC023963 TaxID=3155608 RepID=UPI0034302F31